MADEETTLYVCPLCVVGRALAPPGIRFQDEPWRARTPKGRLEAEEEAAAAMEVAGRAAAADQEDHDGSDGSASMEQDYNELESSPSYITMRSST